MMCQPLPSGSDSGIEEHAQAVALVFVHEMPGQGRYRAERRQRQSDAPPCQSGEKHGENAACRHEQGSAEVRLLGDQQRRRADQQRQRCECDQTRRQFARMQVPRGHHRQGQLDQLGWLEAHDPQVQPAMRAAAFAEHFDHDQQQQARRCRATASSCAIPSAAPGQSAASARRPARSGRPG
jgi:hypothetical protein